MLRESETNKKYAYVLLDKGYILLVGQIRVESNTGADGLRISWIYCQAEFSSWREQK